MFSRPLRTLLGLGNSSQLDWDRMDNLWKAHIRWIDSSIWNPRFLAAMMSLGSTRPCAGFCRALVVFLDAAVDDVPERDDGLEGAVFQPAAGELCEEAFGTVQR